MTAKPTQTLVAGGSRRFQHVEQIMAHNPGNAPMGIASPPLTPQEINLLLSELFKDPNLRSSARRIMEDVPSRQDRAPVEPYVLNFDTRQRIILRWTSSLCLTRRFSESRYGRRLGGTYSVVLDTASKFQRL